jgi:hypothetical protein
MKTKLRNALVKVINGLDRALEGSPRDWVSKVSEVSPENKLALAGLQHEMAAAMSNGEAEHDFLRWFSGHHGKIVEGWGPWKKPSATEQERTAINIAITNYLGTSTLIMERFREWEAGFSAQMLSREDMTHLAPILQDFDLMVLQLRGNLEEILSPRRDFSSPEQIMIEIDVTAVVKRFVKFAAATVIEPLLKHGLRGPSEVDRQMALKPIGMAFVLGFVLAGSYRDTLEKVLSVSLEHPSDVTSFGDMSRMARARGDNLIEKLLGTALSGLSVLDQQSVDIALAMEEVSNACELGLRGGLVLHAVDPAIDREFRDVTEKLKIYPGDDVIHGIIRELLIAYEGKVRTEPY